MTTQLHSRAVSLREFNAIDDELRTVQELKYFSTEREILDHESMDEYQKGRIDDVLVEDLTSSMFPVLSRWLNSVAVKRLSDPYQVAAEIKNMFRVETPIPLTRPNNSIQAEPAYRFYSVYLKYFLW